MSRGLQPLAPDAEALVLAVVDGARDAALDRLPDELAPLARSVESSAPSPLTGYKHARLTGMAGSTAAHALRLQSVDAGPSAPAWTRALAGAGEAISSWDWDVRMQAALDLRKTFLPLGSDAPESVRPVRLVAAWLTHAGGHGLIRPTTQLAQILLEQGQPPLDRAWFATHGLTLLEELSRGRTLSEGNPDAEEKAYRAQLRAVVTQVARAEVIGTKALAERAGITRATLSAWNRAT